MKKILLLAVMLVMCLANACFASDGKVLDAEAKIIDQFFAAKSYKEISSVLNEDMKANFDEAKFNAFKEDINKNLGAIKDKQLVMLQKYPQSDRLIYGVEFERGPIMRLLTSFQLVGEKPLLWEFALIPIQEETKAPAKK